MFGVPGDRSSEVVKAVVVPKPGTTPTPVDIVDYCDGRLTYFNFSRHIDIRDKLSETATERVKKYEMMTEYNEGVWERKSGYELNGELLLAQSASQPPPT